MILLSAVQNRTCIFQKNGNGTNEKVKGRNDVIPIRLAISGVDLLVDKSGYLNRRTTIEDLMT